MSAKDRQFDANRLRHHRRRLMSGRGIFPNVRPGNDTGRVNLIETCSNGICVFVEAGAR